MPIKVIISFNDFSLLAAFHSFSNNTDEYEDS